METELKSAVLITAAAVVGGYILVFGVLRRLNGWYYAAKLGKMWPELPPGDMGWPLIGSFLSFIKDFTSDRPENFIRKFAISYGSVGMYKTHIFGRASIIVCTAEESRKVLKEEDGFIPSFPRNMKVLAGPGSLMNVSKTEHRRLRRLTVGPISGHSALEMYIDYIEETVKSGLQEWESMQRPFELLTQMKKLTFRVIWNIFMGSTALDSSMAATMELLFFDFAVGFGSLPINLPGFSFHKALKARKSLVKMLESIIEVKRTVKKNKGESWEAKDTMDLLMEVRDEDGKQLDDGTIIDLILGKLFAGHETSAYTAMWAVLFLVDNPDCLRKAKEEQEDIIKQRPSAQKGISLAEFKQMKYLSQVIDETLRAARISFFLFREATADVELNGKMIPKGWRVMPWLGEIYKDEKLYSSPQEFNPSRWDNFIPKPGAFTPFGLGSRACPGSDLARLEISIFLHYFVLNYTVKRLNPNCKLTQFPFPHPKDKCLATLLKVA